MQGEKCTREHKSSSVNGEEIGYHREARILRKAVDKELPLRFRNSSNFVVKIITSSITGTGKTRTRNLEKTAPEMTKRLHNS
ncbi:hypothetical protein T4A_201 [Trichinella pseudospiralis]|uniref:Uncharacterized protein n=1 Tax=Trichinella pseudospiralis TaxID=6337 RepID=A0A0V1DM68_TRIPS|nr:hypothetical protein T4A_201 [Trichinella pseudospiralis]